MLRSLPLTFDEGKSDTLLKYLVDERLNLFETPRLFLWRTEIRTHGLINVIGAPHLSESSTYSHVENWTKNSNGVVETHFNLLKTHIQKEGWISHELPISSLEKQPPVSIEPIVKVKGGGLTKKPPSHQKLSMSFAPSGVRWIELQKKRRIELFDANDLLIHHGHTVRSTSAVSKV